MRMAGKERSPQESSPRTWGHRAVPIRECPPLLLQASGCLLPSPLPSHVGGCCSAHTPLLPPSPSRHPSRVGTQIPLSVFPVLSPAAPRHPYSKATIPRDRPVGLENHFSHATTAYLVVSRKLPWTGRPHSSSRPAASHHHSHLPRAREARLGWDAALPSGSGDAPSAKAREDADDPAAPHHTQHPPTFGF